jgi:hypothetical protein
VKLFAFYEFIYQTSNKNTTSKAAFLRCGLEWDYETINLNSVLFEGLGKEMESQMVVARRGLSERE